MGANGPVRAPTLDSSDEAYEDTTDFEIDWVLVYDFTDTELRHAIEEYRILIADLEAHGLQTQVRHGYSTSVLVLVRVPRNLLGNEVYKSRVKDWLYGIIHTRPVGDSTTVVDAETPAEALRSVFHLITWTHEQGGAGVTAGLGRWERVIASFPPHASEANTKLISRLASKTILSASDLDEFRALYGEKVAFYYAFIQSYSVFLLVPSACGILSYTFLQPYSAAFALIVSFWSIVFVEYWKRQEIDLSLRWDVKGVAALKVDRPQYEWDREYLDPTTGEVQKRFSVRRRLLRQMLFLPFALLAGVALGSILIITFILEAWMNDVYGGRLKEHWVFGFIPTILLSLSLPYITSFLEDLATKLSDLENYRTADEYERAQVQKSFVLNFITSFLPVILTAYIYVPYGAALMPPLVKIVLPAAWLKNASYAGSAGTGIAVIHIDASRLQEEVVGLSMTAQLVSFCEELVVPYIQRRYKRFYRRWRMRHHHAGFGRVQERDSARMAMMPYVDAPHEKNLLTRLRNEAEAETYDVQEDIMEMVVQFGYLTLFSCAWPLMPLGFLINNWVELRGDLWKLARESRRPPPIRNQGIGASLGALEFLTLLGSMSAAALVYMYSYAEERGTIRGFRLSGLLLSVFVAEQVYLVVRLLVAAAFERVGSEAVRNEEKRRYVMRKRYLETFSEEAAGTSKRERSKTYASERRGVPQMPSRVGGTGHEKNSTFHSVGVHDRDDGSPFLTTEARKWAPESSLRSTTSTFPPIKPPRQNMPSIELDGLGKVEAQYSTVAAERFWAELEETGFDTTETGVNLITTLKCLQGQEAEKEDRHGSGTAVDQPISAKDD